MPARIEATERYLKMDPDECIDIIRRKKKEFGPELLILTHHYQRKELAPFGDFLGDSYMLAARAAAQKDARYIVFCGVLFMAESADILSTEKQTVYLPSPYAGCPMSDMAPEQQVMGAWGKLGSLIDIEGVLPISYVNSSARLKAFCGRNRGLTCTSGNADKAFDYAFARGERIFFFPDRHLGKNTANKKSIPKSRVVIWDPQKLLGGNSEEDIRNSRVILWKGHCHVHMNFTLEMARLRREENPDIKIVVHPECREELVDAADAVGSTALIVKYVAEQPPGSAIAIGTELNLVERLADEHPDKSIITLSNDSSPLCVNMNRITLNNLAYTLDSIEGGGGNIISVPESVAREAKLALERMLEI